MKLDQKNKKLWFKILTCRQIITCNDSIGSEKWTATGDV